MRQAWGEIQNKLWGVYDSRVAYENAILKYQHQIEKIQQQREAIEDKADGSEHEFDLRITQQALTEVIDVVILVAKEAHCRSRRPRDTIKGTFKRQSSVRQR